MSSVKRPAKQKTSSAQSNLTPEAKPGSDDEAVTASEIYIKLDLARQFLDMGDPESARHMLDEVLKEGNPSQRQEAMRLVDSLP